MQETEYSHRTDSVARKVELLGQALRNGRHDLARSLAASIKDTITFRQQIEQQPEPAVVAANATHAVDDLHAPWRNWAAGWRYFEPFALDETVGLARDGERLRSLSACRPITRLPCSVMCVWFALSLVRESCAKSHGSS
jgi:hypothetical protein